jgi:hypothetical protein
MLQISEDRAAAIANSLENYRTQNDKRTFEIEIRGKLFSLPVIRLTTSMLLLNHDNNRLSAQLDGHPSQSIVQNNPTSQESQIALQKLLSSTKQFNELKEQIKTFGQKKPGLATREGLLIDGNTRLTSILELEKDGSQISGMDVAILPVDIVQKDLLDIEVSIQMTELVHQKYLFTNELLMISRLQNTGCSNKEIATKLNMLRGGEKKVALRLRILSMIKEIRAISNPTIPWSEFDKREEMFKNIDEKYQSLKGSGDLDGAESVKWSRITAMFLGLNKDQVRSIDEDFIQEKIIDSRLEDEKEETTGLKEYLKSYQEDSELDDPGDFFDDNETEENFGRHTKRLFSDMVSSEKFRNTNGTIKSELEGHASTLAGLLRDAARAEILKENEENERKKPIEILREVRLKMQSIKEKIPELSHDKDFRSQDFNFEVNKLKKIANEIVRLREKHL